MGFRRIALHSLLSLLAQGRVFVRGLSRPLCHTTNSVYNVRMSDIPWQNRIISFGSKPADQFQANERNWRKHPTAQQEVMRQSLRRVGWVGVVLENVQTGNVVDGHERIWEAIDNGNADVPFIQVDLTPDEEAFVLATFDTIGHMAVTDGEQLTALLKDIADNDASLLELTQTVAAEMGVEVAPAVPDAPDAPIDRASELQVKWQTARGQVWQVGRHRVMCGDSTSAEDVAVLMGDGRAEMVWTDPPYGVAIGDKNKQLNAIAPSNRVEDNLDNDTLDEPALTTMLGCAFDNAMAYCLAGGAWYVAAPAGPLHVLFGQLLKERGIWHQTIQWVKNNATFSPMGVDYHWRAEPIFYGWLPGAAHRYYGGRQQDTVWEIDRPAKSPEHPTMKPVELVARAIGNSSQRDEIVYDAFLGSGTTAIAAEQLGRVAYGMEISPAYVAVTLERLSLMGLEPVLYSGEYNGRT